MSDFKVFTNFVGIIKKIQTISTGDGDYRITIDVPATCKNAIKDIMDEQGKLCGFAVGKTTEDSVQSNDDKSSI